MKRYTVSIVVSQRPPIALPFPIDMLRYDRCTPSSEFDANKITRTFSEGGTRCDPVTVMRTGETQKRWQPTFGRWESFGWCVDSFEFREEPRS